MKTIIPLLITIFSFISTSNAQSYLEAFTGYQIDVLNDNRFKQFNTAIQYSIKRSNRFELIFQLQQNWPIKYQSGDSAFTQNPALPVYVKAGKTIRPVSISFSVGSRFALFGENTPNIFSVLAFAGIASQQIKVTHQYDKGNYTLLNPDQTQKRVGVFLSWGLEYMRLLSAGRIFVQAGFATPPLGKEINYPSSFSFMSPLSFNAGYSLPLKQSKHGK